MIQPASSASRFQQVEDNLAALRILETEAKQQHESTDSAAQSLDLSQTRYEGGVDTYLQVITCQTAAVATAISGIDSMEVLDQNLAILRDFKSLSPDHMQMLREHGKQFNDGRYELYKSTLKYNSDLGRSQHGYPPAAELPL